MSNYLSVAMVTSSLVNLVQEAVIPKVPGATVSTLRPNSAETGGQITRVNVYLYHVRPNRSWRNEDLPTRLPNGALIERPLAALDLFYLLTFHGDDMNNVPQRMLASVVAAIHSRPILDSSVFNRTRAAQDSLKESDLAESGEQVSLTPVPFSMEDLSRLWSMLQAPFSVSIVYQASVLTIGSDDVVPGAALPVRGG